MEAYVSLFVKAVFIENLALSSSWECVHSLAVSKKISNRYGFRHSRNGLCRLLPFQPITSFTIRLLKEDALSWLGITGADLSF
jgi:Na+-transporting NADH:ubiquinone oxidoreductase subunit E